MHWLRLRAVLAAAAVVAPRRAPPPRPDPRRSSSRGKKKQAHRDIPSGHTNGSPVPAPGGGGDSRRSERHWSHARPSSCSARLRGALIDPFVGPPPCAVGRSDGGRRLLQQLQEDRRHLRGRLRRRGEDLAPVPSRPHPPHTQICPFLTPRRVRFSVGW
jgi:hypothetical protein